jgi:hypothetical protein
MQPNKYRHNLVQITCGADILCTQILNDSTDIMYTQILNGSTDHNAE